MKEVFTTTPLIVYRKDRISLMFSFMGKQIVLSVAGRTKMQDAEVNVLFVTY
ncbi:hypothetical protein DPMN_010466 [Dreissena polymorpha]|uniref:Uncharacterized protein n=1 Tax=Dreissena polymorpha TaxID=45954 RepID=A0A9D4S1J5_DREPO|nr:hypothetical protein DPMN_010466 [Dreissena polymorpha]